MSEAVNAKTVGLGIFIGIIVSVVVTVANGDEFSRYGRPRPDLDGEAQHIFWVDQVDQEPVRPFWQIGLVTELHVDLDLNLTGPLQSHVPTHLDGGKIESEPRWTLTLTRNTGLLRSEAMQVKIVAIPRWLRFRRILDSSRLDADLLDASAALLISTDTQPIAQNSPTMADVSSVERRKVQSLASASHSTVFIPKQRR